MILALNTSQKQHELALIKGDKILAEESWQDERDDVERLAPMLTKLLADANASKEEISDIVVVKGPGSFSCVRTGVAFANALAEALEVRLHSVDTFTLLRLKAAITDPVLVVMNAGGLDVGVMDHEHQVKVGAIAELLAAHPHKNSIHVVSEAKEAQEKELHSICLEKGWTQIPTQSLQSFAQVILTSGLDEFSLDANCEPYYLKSPKITKSTDPWKQA